MSRVVRDLQDAYVRTHYRVYCHSQKIILRIGVRSDELARLQDQFAVDCSAFITAWNPFSKPSSKMENEKANAALAYDLASRAIPCFPGETFDPTGVWPSESSFLALGLSKQHASDCGRKYDQNAIVWIGADATPELVMIK